MGTVQLLACWELGHLRWLSRMSCPINGSPHPDNFGPRYHAGPRLWGPPCARYEKRQVDKILGSVSPFDAISGYWFRLGARREGCVCVLAQGEREGRQRAAPRDGSMFLGRWTEVNHRFPPNQHLGQSSGGKTGTLMFFFGSFIDHRTPWKIFPDKRIPRSPIGVLECWVQLGVDPINICS